MKILIGGELHTRNGKVRVDMQIVPDEPKEPPSNLFDSMKKWFGSSLPVNGNNDDHYSKPDSEYDFMNENLR